MVNERRTTERKKRKLANEGGVNNV